MRKLSSDIKSLGHFNNVINLPSSYSDKKENQIILIYKENQSGAVAKSHMRKGFLINEEMRKYFPK